MAPPDGRSVDAGADPDGDLSLLDEHGDTQVPPGAVDLAVNVWGTPPEWLIEDLRAVDVARYPDAGAAEAAAVLRHGRAPGEVLAVNGAAEAFWALAAALRPRLAVCVHPSFTAPEAALRSADVPVRRVVRRASDGFALDPSEVPDAADFVVLGRPDNPTGRVEPAEVVARLCRPGRTVVVDEAFVEFHADAAGLASRADLPGLVCVRSLTKLWALPGLRVGYVVAEAALIARVRRVLQPWPVNSPAARAIEVLSGAEGERAARAVDVARSRRELLAGLGSVRGLDVGPATANFVLLRAPGVQLRERLLAEGLAVRRCDTFPGLDASYARIAVHPSAGVRRRLVDALHEVLGSG